MKGGAFRLPPQPCKESRRAACHRLTRRGIHSPQSGARSIMLEAAVKALAGLLRARHHIACNDAI